jgi:hypothetical protein
MQDALFDDFVYRAMSKRRLDLDQRCRVTCALFAAISADGSPPRGASPPQTPPAEVKEDPRTMITRDRIESQQH